MSVRRLRAEQELRSACHVLEQSGEFLEISRDGEVQFRHAPNVLFREARGCVRCFQLQHEGVCIISCFQRQAD